jgi:hypothetical protein
VRLNWTANSPSSIPVYFFESATNQTKPKKRKAKGETKPSHEYVKSSLSGKTEGIALSWGALLSITMPTHLSE